MNRVKELRLENKLSQEKLASMLNVHQTAVSQWEKNRTSPDTDTANKIAKMFKVSIGYVLGYENEKKQPTDDPTPPSQEKASDINLDELEFALFGEVRELDDADKEELLRNARRMKELMDLRKKQKGE